MYMLLTDETNTQQKKDSQFLIYGGIFFDISVLSQLNSRIEEIKKKAKYSKIDEFKFDTRSRPEQVSKEDATIAKQEVIQVCNDLHVRFIVCLISHDVIRKQKSGQKEFWAADYVIGRFHYFLQDHNEDGMVIIDNIPGGNQYQYLSSKFQLGLTLSNGKTVQLPQIKMYASSCVNASYANSALDIVIGTFRYLINKPSANVSADLAKSIFPMIYYKVINGRPVILDNGLIIRPKLNELFPATKLAYENMLKSIVINLQK